MATASRELKANTATRILDVAERLVQTRGFNGFSYADIAAELGITKASLHYHFAGKAELGEALIVRYGERFADALAAIDDSARTPAPSSTPTPISTPTCCAEAHVPLRHPGRRVPDAPGADA